MSEMVTGSLGKAAEDVKPVEPEDEPEQPEEEPEEGEEEPH